ncbi:MAG: response regulator transcription factor [Sulfuricella sp.]|nr:response regulator transcription factor [Sulfuricella sp.]
MDDNSLVYIVDDDAAVRDSLSLLLRLKGYANRTFASAEEFLAQARPDWRGCLLLDIGMAGMDGLALQRELANQGGTLPIIFITAHGDAAKARAALKAGAVDFLEKPLDNEALISAIDEALDHAARERQASAARDGLAARLARLTGRERQVLDLVVEGRHNREIAVQLEISPRTVEVYKARMMEKMQVRTLPDLIRSVLSAEK